MRRVPIFVPIGGVGGLVLGGSVDIIVGGGILFLMDDIDDMLVPIEIR